MNDEPIVCDTPAAIAAYRLLAARQVLKLKIAGMNSRQYPAARQIAVTYCAKPTITMKTPVRKLLDNYEAKLRIDGFISATLN